MERLDGIKEGRNRRNKERKDWKKGRKDYAE